jgi:hypothetical protein
MGESNSEVGDDEQYLEVLDAAQNCDVEALDYLVSVYTVDYIRAWRERTSGWSVAHFAGGEAQGHALIPWLLRHGVALDTASTQLKAYAPKKGGTVDIPAGSHALHVAARCARVPAVCLLLQHLSAAQAAVINRSEQTAKQMALLYRGRARAQLLECWQSSAPSSPAAAQPSSPHAHSSGAAPAALQLDDGALSPGHIIECADASGVFHVARVLSTDEAQQTVLLRFICA